VWGVCGVCVVCVCVCVSWNIKEIIEATCSTVQQRNKNYQGKVSQWVD